MRSIKTEFLVFLSIVLAALIIPFIVFVVSHNTIVNEYKSTQERIIFEQDIPAYSGEMVLNYYLWAADINDSEKAAKYSASRDKIDKTLDYLDANLLNSDSKQYYQGIKNSIEDIKSQLDKGISLSKSGDILQTSEIYDKANHENSLVKDQVGSLILQELNFAEKNQVNSQRTDTLTLLFSIIFFIITILATLIYARVFSSRVTEPLVELSNLSKKMSQGDLNFFIDSKLADKKNEIGILASSFQTMVLSLRNKIEELDKAQESQKKINLELEKINKLMIGRELKMAELKRIIEDLKKKII